VAVRRVGGHALVRQVRLYVEGGGDYKAGKSAIRHGVAEFLKRGGLSRVQVVACGNTDGAIQDFADALKTHPKARNLLLVDSDGPVSVSAKSHVVAGSGPGKGRDWRRAKLKGVPEDRVHLMVQIMESWFLADPEALRCYYGQDFNGSALPRRSNVEEVPKEDVKSALANATRNTKKGEYHKIRHAPNLLMRVDPAKVRTRAENCERLFKALLAGVTAQGSPPEAM